MTQYEKWLIKQRFVNGLSNFASSTKWHKNVDVFRDGAVVDIPLATSSVDSGYSAIVFDTANSPAEDFETLMFDPVSQDLYLVQKNHFLARANIYRLTPPQQLEAELVVRADLVGKYRTLYNTHVCKSVCTCACVAVMEPRPTC